MMMQHKLLVATVFLATFAVAPLCARDWADRFGNKTSAKFVRVHEGKVVLLRAGKVMMVPFADLVEDDQQYVREQLERTGQAHLLPAAVPNFPSPGGDGDMPAGDGGEPRIPAVLRVWTDVDDRKITAAYVRTEGDNVVLSMNGREVSVPRERLSRFDQSYVRAREMAEQAMASRPEMPTPYETYDEPEITVDPGNRGGHSDGWHGDEPTLFTSDRAEDAAIGSDVRRASAEEITGSQPAENTQDTYAAHVPRSFPQGGPPPPASAPPSTGYSPPSSGGPPSTGFTPPTGGGSPGPPAAPTPPSTPTVPPRPSYESPMFEEVGVCSSCDKEVSDQYGAGDNCPHCGVFFEYEEDEYGQKTMAPDGSGSEDLRITGRSIRGLARLAIFGFVGFASLCGWLCRKMFSS